MWLHLQRVQHGGLGHGPGSPSCSNRQGKEGSERLNDFLKVTTEMGNPTETKLSIKTDLSSLNSTNTVVGSCRRDFLLSEGNITSFLGLILWWSSFTTSLCCMVKGRTRQKKSWHMKSFEVRTQRKVYGAIWGLACLCCALNFLLSASSFPSVYKCAQVPNTSILQGFNKMPPSLGRNIIPDFSQSENHFSLSTLPDFLYL